MGRAKLKMEAINNEKLRSKAFKRRKDGLVTKIRELTVLCDVSACMIIYGQKEDENPVIWPTNQDEVQKILENYKEKEKDSGVKKFGLSDFFRDKTKNVEEELSELRKQNAAAKYPTYMDFMDLLTRPELIEFTDKLKNKSEQVKSRIQLLKRNKLNQSHSFYNPGLVNLNQGNFFPFPYPSDNYYQEHHSLNQMNSAMINGDNANLMHYTTQAFYDLAGGKWALDPMTSGNAMPLSWYHESMMMSPMTSLPQPLYPDMSGVAAAAPQLQLPFRENDLAGQDDYCQTQYQMISNGN